MFLPLLLACAARTWTHEVKPKGKPDIVAVDPKFLLEASVEDAGFDEIAVRVQVTEQGLDQVVQPFRHAEVGRYEAQSAIDAGNIWMATGGVMGFLGLVGGGYGLSEGENLAGDPVFNWGAALGGFVILGAPILVAGSVQYATPLLPARRKDRRVESRSSIQEGQTSPWVGTVMLTTLDGDVIQQGTTAPDGTVRLVFAVPDVDRVQLELDGPAGREVLDLTGTDAWFDTRSGQVRSLAAAGDVAKLVKAHDIAAKSGATMWSEYCVGFDEGWGHHELERRSQHFAAPNDVPQCQATWRTLDTAWAERLAPGAEAGDSDWDAELPSSLGARLESTPSLAALGLCVELQLAGRNLSALTTPDWLPADQVYFTAIEAKNALIDPFPHTAPCFRAVLADADRQIAQIEAEEAAQRRMCDEAKRAVAKEMPRLTSTAYADTAAYGIRNTRDALIMKMNRMVAYGGPAYDEQEWVQCVTYALTDADDMIRGIYQMNYGGYAHEWVELGRFEWAQEGILNGFAKPDENCAKFVRKNLGSSTLAPVDRYLKAVDRLDQVCVSATKKRK